MARSMRSSMRSSRIGLILLLAISALAVCSCGTMRTVATVPSAATVEAEQPLPRIDPSLLEDCPALPLATDSHLPALQKNHTAVAALYADCRDRHNALVKADKARDAQEAARLQRERAATQVQETPPAKPWWH